ncbi:MAG: RNase adapter RapZ [Acidocella sp.]|nr:RNase adapter RapZ [Acidocella sp.]OYV49520.1 MAG: RNase adaptor protein RapZ [Acidocella sp. 20-58-15]
MSEACRKLTVVLVTGLSGAGKNSVLRALEDLGFETMDNPPLPSLETLIVGGERNIAIGVDARSRGFDAALVLQTLERLRLNPHLAPQLVYVTAGDEFLLRRYTETRRRHPLAQTGQVADGITLERDLTEALHRAADLVIDTSTLPLHGLRTMIEQRFGAESPGLAVSLVSFAYPAGLPREADMVFDARFLRNPHYDGALCKQTGLSQKVAAYIEADPGCAPYFAQISQMVEFLLPRFVQEGKKYATIAIGCTGGQHRSVYLVERLAAKLGAAGWRVAVTHREQPKWDETIVG